MRTNKKAPGVEALELRDVPAMIVPILSPSVTVATPDHWHVSSPRQFAPVDAAAPVSQVSINDHMVQAASPSRASIGPIIDTVFAAGKVSMQDFHFTW